MCFRYTGTIGTTLHFSSNKIDNSLTSSHQDIQGEGSNHSSLATKSSMVCRTVALHSRTPSPLTTINIPRGQQEINLRLQQIQSLDRISFLRACLAQRRGHEAANRIIKGFRESSLRQAETAWSAFKCWIPEKITDIKHQTILDFLIHLTLFALSQLFSCT